ncbi:cathepsin K-like [Trachinotus anak]|uniref:cathepsin K-like n=1 Tax=Trachinotus anak TaxID=443729 RepID=UPI0039F17BE9
MLLHALVIHLVVSDLGFRLNEVLLDIQWEQWKIRHEQEYDDDDEEHYREDIWKRNMHLIEVHNREAEQGKHSYTLGMNHLGDRTKEELCHSRGETTEYLWKEATQDMVYNTNCSLEDLPESIDYREKGMVTSVKDQGSCGSCWAFSAVGALEGQLARTTGQLLDLSPQNLVDCDQESKGCGGGDMTRAFEYVQENGGINSEKDYPYVGWDQHCYYQPSAIAAQVKGFETIPEGDECALAQALYDVGPLSVTMDTNSEKFWLYKSGVYYNPENKKNHLDHAMLLVGYGETAEGEKYWIVKNSYGANWGDNGYIRIARDRDNHCGIASEASYPIM